MLRHCGRFCPVGGVATRIGNDSVPAVPPAPTFDVHIRIRLCCCKTTEGSSVPKAKAAGFEQQTFAARAEGWEAAVPDALIMISPELMLRSDFGHRRQISPVVKALHEFLAV